MSSIRPLLAIPMAAVLLAGGHHAQAADLASKPMRWKSLVFRCAVADGPRLHACTPLKAKGVSPEILTRSRLDVEAIPACRLAGLKPGMQVDYPFSYSDDPRFLQLPRPLVVITNVDWAEPPPMDKIAQLYPEQALASRATARVTMKCRVAIDGAARDCQVVQEEPVGLGFGDAGATAMTLMRFKPQMRDCTPTDTGSIVMPLVFRPPSQGG